MPAPKGRAVGREWLSVSGFYLVPDPQRTPAAERGLAQAHEAAAVDAVRARFDQVDARDWLGPSRLVRVFGFVEFRDTRDMSRLGSVEVGPRTPSQDLTVAVRLDHHAAKARPVEEVADEAVEKLRAGFRAMAKRYRLGPFPFC